MAGKAEIILGVINDGVSIGSSATAVADQFVTNQSGMVLLNQSAQTGAVIASVTSVTKLAGPYVPIINMPANIVAGTITFMKIGVDIRDGAEFNKGDMVSLVGNIAGVIGTMAVLVGAGPGLVGVLTIISIGAGLYSIKNAELVENIIISGSKFFRTRPSSNYLDYLCAPDMKIVDRNTLRMGYANRMLSCNWISATGELLPSSVFFPDENNPGGGRSAGGIAFGGAPGPIVTVPPRGVANVGISIIVGGNTYDAGDQYGCCTGTSDGYM